MHPRIAWAICQPVELLDHDALQRWQAESHAVVLQQRRDHRVTGVEEHGQGEDKLFDVGGQVGETIQVVL